MITGKPNPNDFKKQAIQYLFQSIELIIDKDPEQIGSDLEYLLEDINYDKEKYWQYHQGVLNNSLILLFLSLENYLKKEICTISPLLLLADEPRKWGSKNKEKKFTDLYIYQFDDLLSLYQELELGDLSSKTTEKLELLRKRRNQITHGIIKENITPQYICETFYIIMFHIWGARVWWDQLKTHIFSEPLFGIYDLYFEKASVVKYIHFFISYIGKKKTGEILGIDLKQRKYICPQCHNSLNSDREWLEVNFSVLKPNTPTSTNLYCIICDNKYIVKRKNCAWAENGCKGNVIYRDEYGDETCLTCFGS